MAGLVTGLREELRVAHRLAAAELQVKTRYTELALVVGRPCTVFAGLVTRSTDPC